MKRIHTRTLQALTALLLLFTLTACIFDHFPCPEPALRDGDWDGLGEGRSGMIKVRLSVRAQRITDIMIVSQSESKFAQSAENEIIRAVLEANGLEGVDAVAGATLTSRGMMQAIASALDAARGQENDETAYHNTQCDVVIVGAGGAGLSAALEAHSLGKDVIVLEKQGIVGGNTNSSTGGINAAETPLQTLMGITDSKALFFADIMTGGYNLGDSSLVQVLSQNAAEAVAWLGTLGADLSDVGMMAGSSVPRTHRPKGGAAIGPHLMSVLYKQVQAQGIEVRTRNRVTGLQMQGGRITGVEVEAGRTHYTIQAKAVVIATGGFGANPTLLTRYKPELLGFSTSNHAGATGDAVQWIQKAGGALTQMDQIQVHPTGERLSHLLITEAVRGNGAILVNQEGQRFANEMLTRDKLTEAMLAQSGRHAYLVFDQAVRNSLAAIENYAQQGFLYSAQTYTQLARDLHIAPQVLEQSLADYARYQASGEDEAFGRRAQDMPLPLTTPPFYAIDVEPVIHHTMGGLKIGPNAQVLNTQGLPLPGLYAAGEVTGGIHGGNRLGGNAVADIIVFGRLAGRSAAQAE